LVREVKEELGITLESWHFFRRFDCAVGDAYANVKYIYWAVLSHAPRDLTLYEGQRLKRISMAERQQIKFANILGSIVEEFVNAGLWPRAEDKF
jgi:8-oxo-dGTP pyrophosphatase MutT (NUDIX family)